MNAIHRLQDHSDILRHIFLQLRWHSLLIILSSDRCALLQAHVQPLLHHEPPAVRLPLLVRLLELEIVVHEEGRDELRPVEQFPSASPI